MKRMRRTTILLPDDLFSRAKKEAVERRTTLTALITSALRESLLRRPKRKAKSIELITYGAGGVAPGVDLDNTASLLDLMESERDALYRR